MLTGVTFTADFLTPEVEYKFFLFVTIKLLVFKIQVPSWIIYIAYQAELKMLTADMSSV